MPQLAGQEPTLMYKLINKFGGNSIVKAALIIAASIASINLAAETYKCEVAGRISFQSKPCMDGHQTIIDDPQQPAKPVETPSDVEDGLEIGKFIIKFDHDRPNGKNLVYKVGVTNHNDHEVDLNLYYRAVDREGFFVKRTNANGVIPANSYRILTNEIYLTQREYARMYAWEIVRQTVRTQLLGEGVSIIERPAKITSRSAQAAPPDTSK